ncbi:MAG: hypothetical protein LC541_17965 [Candidatus Thiodiazotropha sp.]|nr:hypothetical protein [Candidatus Thiodiazotropha sp.]
MKILQPVTKVLLTLLIVLVVAETLLRLVESHLSGNVAHIQEIPELSAQYDQYSEPGILFLGNSLSNNAIDAPLFRSEMDEQGVVFSVIEKIVPDATTIWSWSCILRNRIFELDNKPNTVFIGFAWNQLADQSRLLPTRLGGFFCTNTDLMHLARQAKVSSAEIGEFLTASTFRMFTHREIIRNKVLELLIPHYVTATQDINRRQRNETAQRNEHSMTYSELEEIVSSIKSFDKDVVLLAFPIRDKSYELDTDLVTLAKDHNVSLLDYRNLDGITKESFLDEMHLSENGSALLTRRLVEDFVKIRSTVQ